MKQSLYSCYSQELEGKYLPHYEGSSISGVPAAISQLRACPRRVARERQNECVTRLTEGEAAGACWPVHRSCAFTFDLVGRTAQCAVDMHTDGRGSDTHSKGRDGDTHMDHRRPELRRRVSPPARDLRPPSLTWMGRRDSCRQQFAAFRRRFPPLSGRLSGHDHGADEASQSAWCGITLHSRLHPQVSLHVAPIHALSTWGAVTVSSGVHHGPPLGFI